MADEIGQSIMEIAKDLVGASGMLDRFGSLGSGAEEQTGWPDRGQLPSRDRSPFAGVDPIWHYGFLFSPALTLGGGTFAIQRNIVAEHVLGLPREPNVEQGMSWSETRSRQPA